VRLMAGPFLDRPSIVKRERAVDQSRTTVPRRAVPRPLAAGMMPR